MKAKSDSIERLLSKKSVPDGVPQTRTPAARWSRTPRPPRWLRSLRLSGRPRIAAVNARGAAARRPVYNILQKRLKKTSKKPEKTLTITPKSANITKLSPPGGGGQLGKTCEKVKKVVDNIKALC